MNAISREKHIKSCVGDERNKDEYLQVARPRNILEQSKNTDMEELVNHQYDMLKEKIKYDTPQALRRVIYL